MRQVVQNNIEIYHETHSVASLFLFPNRKEPSLYYREGCEVIINNISSSNFLHEIFTPVRYYIDIDSKEERGEGNVGITYNPIGSGWVFMVLSFKSN